MSQYRKTFSRVAHIVLPPGVLLRLRRYRRKQSAVIEAIELQRDHLSAIETSSYRTREQLNAQHNELQTKLGEVTVHLDAKLHTLAAQVAQLLESNDIQLNRLLGRVSTMAAATEAQSVAPAGTGDTRLYLDLLEDELTGMLHQDQSQAPWAADKFDAGRREIGRDWPKTAATMIGTARMRNVRQLCQRALAEGVPGDFVETGVWRGGCCIYMRGILAAAGDTTRRVFVADSFKGLPPPDAANFPADAGDPHHQFEQLAISRAEVEANFKRYHLLDERVVFLEGWFKDTLPRAPIEKLAILRLDGDMYESTMQALDALYAKVSPGGYVIVDDYILPACAKAVDEFRARHAITAPLQAVDGAAVWWQVP